MAYRAPDVGFAKYAKFWFPPLQIYSGEGADFDGASEQDKERVAQYMRTEFIKVFGEKYPIVNSPGPRRRQDPIDPWEA